MFDSLRVDAMHPPMALPHPGAAHPPLVRPTQYALPASPNVRLARLAENNGILGVDWDEFPNLAFLLALLLLFETVVFDAIVLVKCRQQHVDRTMEPREQQRRKLKVVLIGCISLVVGYIFLVAFGVTWSDWPLVCFVLVVLMSLEASAIASVYVHARFFGREARLGNYSALPLVDDEDEMIDEGFGERFSGIKAATKYDRVVLDEEADFGDKRDIF